MKVITIIGARPQFIKAAVVSQAISKYNAGANKKIEEKIIHTGQHYDKNMSDVFFDELNIPAPYIHLNVGSGLHGVQTGLMIERIEQVLVNEKPDVLLTYGDTNSTLAGALAAAKLHIPIAHVEAGLRSFNKGMPEEINRVLTDHVSTFLYCPTVTAVENLKNEGIEKGVEFVGDVMFDSMLHYQKSAHSQIIETLGLTAGNYIFATVHRAENTDNTDRLKSTLAALEVGANLVGTVILSLHPRTKKMLSQLGYNLPSNIKAIEPVPYLDMIALLSNAKAIMTDSGGVQKEAYFLQVPCLTLRDETEWVETISCGANRLIGSDPNLASCSINDLIYKRWNPDFAKKPYGSGNSADLIIASLVEAFIK